MSETPRKVSRDAVETRKKKAASRRAPKKSLKRRVRRFLHTLNYRKLIMIVVAVLLLIVLCVGIRNCGVSHKSPEKVVRELINAYGDGDTGKVLECYGVKNKEAEDALQNEIDATVKYFQVHEAKKISVEDCGVLFTDKSYSYVYVIYHMELQDGQIYPGIGTYMTECRDEKFYVLPTSQVTADMSENAASKYAEFMNTDPYKEYTRIYDTFVKKNPGYEEKIAGKLK